MNNLNELLNEEGMPVQRYQSRIARIELQSDRYWEVILKPQCVVSLSDVQNIYQYIQNKPTFYPILMDLSPISGIEFEALEYLVYTVCLDKFHPLALVVESGSISEKYAHLIEQMSENIHPFSVFKNDFDAKSWLTQYHNETVV